MDKNQFIHSLNINEAEKEELLKMLSNKSYGLNWERKSENAAEVLREREPLLIRDEGKSVGDQSGIGHKLILGENLLALTALESQYRGEIDLIYIDPPYNTGAKEEFVFNDNFVEPEDEYRHSKWISFMENRLLKAHTLLKEDGVIFCSIGDEEVANLILLCNRIFGQQNQLGIITRVAKTAGDKGNFFAPSKDYVLAYAKQKAKVAPFVDAVDEKLFKKIETHGERAGEAYRDDVAFYQASLDERPNQRYYVECPDGSLAIPPGKSMPVEAMAGSKVTPEKGDGVWRWSLSGLEEKKELLVFKESKRSPLLDPKGNRSRYNIYTKSYLKDRLAKGKSPRDYLDQFINRQGADLLKQYDLRFNYSKPVGLIQHLIRIANKPKDIQVLDFFAGSGTTMHAVLQLNQEDGGRRSCILVTNNENGICENITYPRVVRLLQPYVNKAGKSMPWFPGNAIHYYECELNPIKHSKLQTVGKVTT